MRKTLVTLGLAFATTAALAAGQIEVRFKPVWELADAGNDRFDGERNLKALAEHFAELAKRLPDGHKLVLDVQDLDLAGRVEPTRRGQDIRIMRNLADWPTMQVRWTLSAGGRALRSGDERVSDMAYLQRPLGAMRDGALAYELRMIDRWFDERILRGADPH